jgi:hypothetical protein
VITENTPQRVLRVCFWDLSCLQACPPSCAGAGTTAETTVAVADLEHLPNKSPTHNSATSF